MAFDLKILVVDDNEGDILLFNESIELAQDFLMSKDITLDFSILEAYDGDEAIKILEREGYNNFQLIFLDIKMPKMNGIDCLTKIREHSEDTYVIMFTTSDYDDDIKTAKKLGANGYLLKSIDVAEFEENLKSILVLFIQDNFIFLDIKKNKYKNLL